MENSRIREWLGGFGEESSRKASGRFSREDRLAHASRFIAIEGESAPVGE